MHYDSHLYGKWPASMYVEALDKKNIKLDKDSREFLEDFFDVSKESDGKKLYYYALSLLSKPLLPYFVIKILAKYRFKKKIKKRKPPKKILENLEFLSNQYLEIAKRSYLRKSCKCNGKSKRALNC